VCVRERYVCVRDRERQRAQKIVFGEWMGPQVWVVCAYVCVFAYVCVCLYLCV